MKKLIYTLALIFCVAILSSCNKSENAVYTGVIHDYQGSEVILMDAIKMDGNTTPVEVASDGSFTIELPAAEPTVYYLLINTPRSGIKLYAEKGLKANLDITFSPEKRGGQTITKSVVDYSGDYKDVFFFLDSVSYFDAQNEVLQATIANHWDFNTYRQTLRGEVDALEVLFENVGSREFRQMMRNDYESHFTQSLFWYPEVGDKHDADFLAFLNTVNRDSSETIGLLFSMAYRSCCIADDKDANIEIFRQLPSLFKNDDIRNTVADYQMEYVLQSAPSNIEEVFDAYKQSIVGHEVPVKILNAMTSATKMKPGSMSVDFEMYDTQGNKVMFSSLKGRAVYLDVWASWCGPCRAEIPYMVNLYNRYKNNSKIVFVSISVDSNPDDWKKIINSEHPAWPQYILRNANESPLINSYQIQGIPRFILIDKDGRVADVNAPRPSDPQAAQRIDQVINGQ